MSESDLAPIGSTSHKVSSITFMKLSNVAEDALCAAIRPVTILLRWALGMSAGFVIGVWLSGAGYQVVPLLSGEARSSPSNFPG